MTFTQLPIGSVFEFVGKPGRFKVARDRKAVNIGPPVQPIEFSPQSEVRLVR
jgi:hypothetical protein